MKYNDKAQMVVTGGPDALSAIKRAIESIDELGSVGAGVTIIARTGDGDKEVSYFDGDGGARVSVSEVTKQEIESESNMKIDLNKGVESQSKKKKSARSKMLKMIMPMLSQENGEQLAAAIEQNSPGKAKKVMDRITKQLTKKLGEMKK